MQDSVVVRYDSNLFVIPEREEDGLQREWKFLWEEPLGFFHEKYGRAGLGPGSLPRRTDIPLTRASELRADEQAEPPFGTHRVVTPERAVEVTSWTDADGEPFLIFYGARDAQVRDLVFHRALARIGLRAGDRLTHTTPGGLRAPGLWRTLAGLDVVELAVGLPADDGIATGHLRLWRLLAPTCFLLTGGQLHRYLKVCARQDIDPRSVFGGGRVILTDTVYQAPRVRRELAARLDAEIYVLAVVPEVPALIAGECRYHCGLHVPDEYVYLEVCDPVTGRPLPDGERGHLVVTTAGLDSVWIRYDLGQIGYLDGSPCPCGERGPRFVRLGRANRSVVVDGRIVTPADVRLALGADFGPRFRLFTREPGTLGLEVEAGADLSEAGRRLGEATGLPVDVRLAG